jgi:hypothetical protein
MMARTAHALMTHFKLLSILIAMVFYSLLEVVFIFRFEASARVY